MAISTYGELQAAIVTRSHRSDVTSLVPDFITLAEARLNRTPRLRTMETEASLACTVGVRTIALPADYESPVACWLVDTDREPLSPRLPQDLEITTDDGCPQRWAIDGANIAFDCPADQAYPVILRYLARFALSGSDSTNWLLTNNPDVYLYAALCELAMHIEDEKKLARWEARFSQALSEVRRVQSRQRPAILTTEFAGHRSNILRGW